MTRFGRLVRIGGIAASLVGVALIAVSTYYLVLYMRSGSDADQFNLELSQEAKVLLTGKTAPRPDSVVAPEVVPISARATDESEPRTSGGVTRIARAEALTDEDIASERPSDVATAIVSPEQFASLHPGGSINPRYWSQPQWAGNLPFGGPQLPDGFIPVDPADTSISTLTGAGNTEGRRMRIPAINLDATVDELELRDLGDTRQWSTPNRVVGHIPSTANPGEARLGWYFGHLDNFISNEGDIFRHLPKIAELIRFDPVDIFIETDDAEYVYRVTGTRQLHRDELRLTDTNDAQIVLVTCWPFRVYDHRILVSASLIAIRPFAPASVATG